MYMTFTCSAGKRDLFTSGGIGFWCNFNQAPGSNRGGQKLMVS